jgi:hypothetical protein
MYQPYVFMYCMKGEGCRMILAIPQAGILQRQGSYVSDRLALRI